MVEEPDELAARYVEAGCELLIVHAEACRHLHRTLGHIARARRPRRRSPSTRPRRSSAVEHVLDLVDLVLVMTVNPGFGGQAYIATMEPKIAELRRLILERRPRRRHRGRRRHRPDDHPGRGGGRRQRARGRIGAVPRPRGPRPRRHRAARPRRGHPPLSAEAASADRARRRRRRAALVGAVGARRLRGHGWRVQPTTTRQRRRRSARRRVARQRRATAAPRRSRASTRRDPEAALDQLRTARGRRSATCSTSRPTRCRGRPPGGDRLRAGAHRRARERAEPGDADRVGAAGRRRSPTPTPTSTRRPPTSPPSPTRSADRG